MHSTAAEVDLRLEVARRETVADGVVALDLRDPSGADLPAWTPGAHVDLELTPDLVRQYSLCGDPADRSVWRIGVLREPQSRGGSALVHESLSREPGDDVTFIEIVRPLLRLAEESLQSPDRPVHFELAGDGGRIPASVATPLSVVLTELMQNAVDQCNRLPQESGIYCF